MFSLDREENKIIHPSQQWANAGSSKDVQQGITKHTEQPTRRLLSEAHTGIDSEWFTLLVSLEPDNHPWPLVSGQGNDPVSF